MPHAMAQKVTESKLSDKDDEETLSTLDSDDSYYEMEDGEVVEGKKITDKWATYFHL